MTKKRSASAQVAIDSAERQPTPEEIAAAEVEETELRAQIAAEAAHAVNASDAYSDFKREMKLYPMLAKEAEWELHRRWKTDGDVAAREMLVCANLALVDSMAGKYSRGGRGMSRMDLVQAGIENGLLKALRNFRPEYGFKFSTYATWWIRQGITRDAAAGTTVKRPVHTVERLQKARRLTARLAQALGQEPTYEEIAAEMTLAEQNKKKDPRRPARRKEQRPKTWTAEDIATLIQRAGHETVSLDSSITSDGETTRAEVEPDENVEQPDAIVTRADQQAWVNAILDGLTSRERRVLQLRFGLDGGQPRTLEEVGREFNVTRERIRQIEAKALHKLRRPARAKFLRDFRFAA